MTAVRARHDDIIGKLLPLLDLHLEESLTRGALAAEESLVIRRYRDRGLETSSGLFQTGDAMGKSMLPAHWIIQASSPMNRDRKPDVSQINLCPRHGRSRCRHCAHPRYCSWTQNQATPQDLRDYSQSWPLIMLAKKRSYAASMPGQLIGQRWKS